jgi:triosephosphate isomerase
MRKKILMGNWKMNGRLDSVTSLLKELCLFVPENSSTEVVVLPPAIYLPLVSSFLLQSSIKWGAQNVYPADAGAFTGELSAPMLEDFGCHYVLVGHSERRTLFQENEKFIADKFHHVKEHGMIPVLCVGETMKEREAGQTTAVITRQMEPVALKGPQAFSQCVIAYEPVWAIGTGETPSPTEIQEVHSTIRALITGFGEEGQKMTLLYGGSLNTHNAKAIFAMPDVDGGLIGGASLDAQKFVEILACINSF